MPVEAQQRNPQEVVPTAARAVADAVRPSDGLPSVDLPGSDGVGTDDDASVGATASAPARGALSPELSTRLDRSGSSLVEVSGADASVTAAVRQSGGSLKGGANGVYLATVPNSSLRTLGAAAGIQSVAVPMDVESARSVVPRVESGQVERGPVSGQNVAAIAPWHATGLRGAGSKVGLIALFDPATLATEISSGELPAIPAGNTTCISAAVTCPFGTVGQTWGNSLAEIIADGAPDATLYLAELGYRTDYYQVIDWMASKGVTILVNPIVWTYDGPGNGTGPSAAIVDYAVSKGIAWFNTAGELGFNYSAPGTYWRGAWSDTDNDKWLNFKGSDESLTVYCGLLLGMRWSDWGKVPTDYDLYISDYRANNRTYGTKKIASGYNQSIAGAQPVEATFGIRLCNSNAANGPVYDTNGDGYVSLYVQRTTRTPDSPVGDVIEIGAYYGFMEHSTSDGSVGIAFADSANPGMVTVGGDMYNVSSGLPGTGSGPTNDGRVKPDIATTACFRTSQETGDNYCSNGGYYGADAAAASLAGWAAVAAATLGATSPSQIALYVRDLGRWNGEPLPTPSSFMGYGLAQVPAVPPAAYPSTAYHPITPFRLIDTRPAPSGPIGVPTARRIRKGETLHMHVYSTGTALILNVAMVKPSGKGFLSVQPAGWSLPTAVSSVNADAAGQTRANTVIVPLGDANYIDIYSSVDTDIIVDQMGYFEAVGMYTAQLTSGRFVATTPHRVLDSRTCLAIVPCDGSPRAAGSWTPLTVRGLEDPVDAGRTVPNDAAGAVVSVTIDQPAANGFLSVTPGNVSVASTSNLNYQAGRSATMMAIVPINGAAAGAIKVYTSATAHVQVDLLGWFSGTVDPDDPAGLYVPVRPHRQLDTRLPAGTPAVTAGTVVQVGTASAGVPANAAAVLVNNAAVNTLGAGEVQVAADAPAQPASFRNLTSGAAGQVIAASTITATDAGSYVVTGNFGGHFLSDLFGYFTALGETPPHPLHQLSGVQRIRAISDDGDVIVSELDDTVYVLRRSTGVTQSLHFDIIEDWTRFHLDASGTLLGFTATRYTADSTSGTHAYLLDLTQPLTFTLASTYSPVGNAYRQDAVGSISDDGRYVLLSTTDGIDPADTVQSSWDTYIRDRSTDTYRWVTEFLPNGGNVLMSDDGSSLVWTTPSSATSDDLHTLDLVTGETHVVNLGVQMYYLDINPDATAAVVTAATYSSSTGKTSYHLTYVDLIGLSTTPVPLPAELLTATGRYEGDYAFKPGATLSADGSMIALSSVGFRGIFIISPAGQLIERIDRTASGLLPNSTSGGFFFTPGFEFVVFSSSSTNLLAQQVAGQYYFYFDRTI